MLRLPFSPTGAHLVEFTPSQILRCDPFLIQQFFLAPGSFFVVKRLLLWKNLVSNPLRPKDHPTNKTLFYHASHLTVLIVTLTQVSGLL